MGTAPAGTGPSGTGVKKYSDWPQRPPKTDHAFPSIRWIVARWHRCRAGQRRPLSRRAPDRPPGGRTAGAGSAPPLGMQAEFTTFTPPSRPRVTARTRSMPTPFPWGPSEWAPRLIRWCARSTTSQSTARRRSLNRGRCCRISRPPAPRTAAGCRGYRRPRSRRGSDASRFRRSRS